MNSTKELKSDTLVSATIIEKRLVISDIELLEYLIKMYPTTAKMAVLKNKK